jgi:sarcosine oxidase subunit beta
MTADVVIIGGGAMGTATAYQMSKAGLDVALCEMRNLASGATGRCGGMVVHCYGRETNIDKAGERLKFTRANTAMLKQFQQELDIDYEFRHVGCLDIASSEAEAEDLRALVEIQRNQGDDEIELLDKEETLARMPTLNPDLVFASRWRPSDGNLAPYKMCAAFGQGAQKNGAKILTHTKVNKIIIENDKVKGVETDKGVILCNWVLNATNAWSKYLTKETACVIPVREIACVTESIGPVPPMSFEMLLDGEFAYGGTQTASGNLTIGGPAHPRDKRLGYYNEVTTINEVQRLGHYMATIFPKLKDLKIIRAWTGTMGFTPDGMPSIGKSTLTEGLLIAAGFAAGISQECTVGKIMTEIVTKGAVSLDINLSHYDPGRFLGKTFDWPDPYDLSIAHDYLAAKKRGLEYRVPYDLVSER